MTQTQRVRLDDGSYRGQLTVRLPSKGVPGFLARARALGKVLEEATTGEDITEGYVDLEARLKNARAFEERLLDLLRSRPAKLSDVLEVEREVSRVRGEIEAMEAQKRNWDLQTETVAVTVELSEPPKAAPALYRVWRPLRTALAEALVAFADSLRALILFLGAALPWLFLLALVGYPALKVYRKKRGGRVPPSAPPPGKDSVP